MLAHQFISKSYRLIRKRDSKPFYLWTAFLTFEVPTLPSLSGMRGYLFTCTFQTLWGASFTRALDTPGWDVLRA
jgi:hypothetical protein